MRNVNAAIKKAVKKHGITLVKKYWGVHNVSGQYEPKSQERETCPLGAILVGTKSDSILVLAQVTDVAKVVGRSVPGRGVTRSRGHGVGDHSGTERATSHLCMSHRHERQSPC